MYADTLNNLYSAINENEIFDWQQLSETQKSDMESIVLNTSLLYKLCNTSILQVKDGLTIVNDDAKILISEVTNNY